MEYKSTNCNEKLTKEETTIETANRRNTQIDFSTTKENIITKNSSKTTTENGIIEQLHKEILTNDWSKYFKTIKEEEK